MFLERDGVVLRDFTVSDVKKKVQWINDPKNNTYLHYDIPLSVEKTIDWFGNRDLKKRIDCIIEYERVSVGVIGLLNIDLKDQKAEYYITLGEEKHKRKGIATIASFILLEYAFLDLQLNKIYLNVDAENTNACHLYEKIGMTCEGYFREDMFHHGKLIDRKRYAILKKEFHKKEEVK